MTLTSIAPEIGRDRWGRPLILDPEGNRVAYTRATTLAGAIEDLNGLITWKIGRAITGLVDRPDLLLSAAAHRDDKKKLYAVCDQALEAGGASAAATVGTAVHSFTEQLDRGLPVGQVPEQYRADIDAYEKATQRLTRLHVEQLLVIDELKVAGTPDLIVEFEGENYIADKKTGSIDFPHKMAAQLALYAHGQMYDPATGQRTPLPAVNGQRGIIIHLPAGTGQCTLHWIDIQAGWEAVQLAVQVREWRKRKGLLAPVNGPTAVQSAVQTYLDGGGGHTDAGDIEGIGEYADDVLAQLEAAQTPEELVAIWAANESAWTDAHTAAAAHRKLELAS